MSLFTSTVRTVGHAALGVPFILLGYESAREPGRRVQLAEGIGVPSPEKMVRFNGAAMVAGGLALTIPEVRRAAALGLAASLVPTTLAGHPYWKFEDPAQRTGQRINFLKNVGLAGAMIAVALAPRSTQD